MLFGVYRSDIFAFDFVSVAPLPVQVLVVVDGFRRFCGAGWDIIWEIFVVARIALVLDVVFCDVCGLFLLSLLFFRGGELVCVFGDYTKAFRGLSLHWLANVFREFFRWCRECAVV